MEMGVQVSPTEQDCYSQVDVSDMEVGAQVCIAAGNRCIRVSPDVQWVVQLTEKGVS